MNTINMETVFLVNPAAGRGRADGIWKRLMPRALELFPGARVLYTEGPGHATELARAHPGTCIIVVGGDGTFHEALQGAWQQDCVMGILPAGSGNDLVRALNLPSRPEEVLERLGKKEVRVIDLGQVADQVFVNGAGIGFDARVTDMVNRGFRLLKGHAAYLAALVICLFTFRGTMARVEGENFSFHGRILIVTAANGPFLGGGIHVAPGARPDSGRLRFCLIRDIPVLKRLTFFAKVIRGEHENLSFVTLFDDTQVRVETEDSMPVHADGEICGKSPARFTVLPGVLKVLV